MMLKGEMRFAGVRSPLIGDPKTWVEVEFDAVEFEDSVGSFLGGPWEVGVISLDLDAGDEFTEFGEWLKEGEGRGWVRISDL